VLLNEPPDTGAPIRDSRTSDPKEARGRAPIRLTQHTTPPRSADQRELLGQRNRQSFPRRESSIFLHTDTSLVHRPLKIVRGRARLFVPTPLWSGHFCPRSNGHGRRHKRRNPLPAPSAKARGVLGSPTGHPFFIVDGDNSRLDDGIAWGMEAQRREQRRRLTTDKVAASFG
jgi:hypothetical protein